MDQIVTRHRPFFGDARHMAEVASGSARLTVTSPPYPMIEMWDGLFCSLNSAIRVALDAGDGRRAHELMHAELDRVWQEVDRVTAPSGIVCVNVGDATRAVDGAFRMYNNHSRIARYFEEAGYDELPSVLWRKPSNKPNKFMGSGMLPPNAYVTLEHERICIFRKGGNRTFAGAEAAARRQSAYFWEERNVWFSDVWGDLRGAKQQLGSFSRAAEPRSRDRSAAFPLEVPYRLINMYSIRGDTVLDPFLGTGTTMAAAMAAGRHSAGYEIDPGLRPAIESRMAGLKELGNGLVDERLAKHEAFVKARRHSVAPAYRSGAYGFPVVTSQEVDIVLP
ncbi:MAG TPA: site-specific DNA-methyltransferase, partial [Methanocella sp.]|nr:site-specific DNA-methyltransferase [Methanocella sp.]